MKPLVSVVIPTRDRGAILSRTLDALELQTPASGTFEVIVVDDGSRDDTPGRLAARPPGRFVLHSIRLEGGGPAIARNAGIALAAADRVLLLGDDTIPRPEAVLRHLEAAAGREVGVQGHIDWHPEEEITRVMRYLAPAGPQFYFARLRAGAFIPYTGLLGSNFSAPRRWFLSEKFDERFPHAAFEDTELAFRWSRRGWRSVYAPDALCWHSHRYSSIEPFLARQNRAGAAARYAVRKHPALLFRTVLQPLVVGIARAARARLRRPMRIEDEWDLRTRLAFLRGVAARRTSQSMTIPVEVAPASESGWWRGGASILAGRGGDALLRFGLFFATAALLSGPEFSLYALLTAALGTTQGAAGLGAARVATYFHSRTSANALVGWLITLAILPSAIVFAALGSALLRTTLFPAVPGPLVFLGLSPLPFLLLTDSLSAILLTRRRERLYGALLWARSGATAIVLASSLLAPNRLLWLLAGRLVVAVLLLIPYFHALSLKHLRGTFEIAYPAFRFGLPVAGAGAVVALHRRADVFLLSALGRTLEIGAYAIAYALAEAFWTITDSLEAALFVDLARQNDAGARTEARRAAALYAAIAAAALVFGMAGGIVFLRLGFGRRHPAAAGLFPWLLVAAVAWGFSRPFSSYLYSRGRGGQVLFAHAGCLALNVVLCLLWIPAAGAAGAARATLASYGVDTLVLVLLARRRARAPDAVESDHESS